MKFTLLICAAIWLSSQCVNSFPIPHSHSWPWSRSTSEETNNPERNNLLAFAIEEFSELAKNTVRRHKTTFEALVKELQASDDKSRHLQTKLNEFEQFNSRAEKLAEKKGDAYTEELFTLFPLGIDLEEKYNLDESKDAKNEDRLIEQQLKKHGVQEGGVTFLLEFQTFSDKLTRRIQDYVDSLTEDEKKKDSELVEWFRKFNLQSDFEKKMNELMEFFDLFEKN